ncbi:hypothetical protein GCM10007857_04560 [Bradyrhizobium iriomotense]|uniref:Secreted protein n=1 Tax=Bradyrhizobium iriomotense TaxID=441950 RepID=A0ABQ6ARB8_9BRAD|nr:hypothetical protein GCM10007857_04560 [Bradyrhizobium iriomotense]
MWAVIMRMLLMMIVTMVMVTMVVFMVMGVVGLMGVRMSMVMRMRVSHTIRMDVKMFVPMFGGLGLVKAARLTGLHIENRRARLGATTTMPAHQAASSSISILLIRSSSPWRRVNCRDPQGQGVNRLS